ncbi:MAG: serine/threonine protein kinase [Solirubrobacterales bacterium]|nr:serine/threonine protein kinase [Solirubrobacterales bacterium]
MTTLLGTTLNGRYRLEARIGAGGMSTVYRATDETLQRRVAIKLMHREIASDSDQLERFRREARAVAQLSHPHIVGVIDYGEDDGRPYIVFEYVEGETLKERIRRNGRLPITEAVAYAIEIARALGTAHARHIVHRDVKPQNVLIDEEGSAKVTDFGIARTLDEEGLTADGRVLGTTDYVSPEQALGRPVTGQSDLYSLGIVLYEMLTGEVPFKGENQVAVAMKHVREQLPDVQYRRPEVSAALASVIDTATAKRVEDRYADDAELIADLEDVLAIETARAGSATGEVTSVLRTLPSQTQRRIPFRIRHRGRALALMLALLAIAGGVVAWLAATRAHHEAPKLAISPPPPHQIQLRPCSGCAHDYNPDAISGPKSQSPQLDGLAIDGNTQTPWVTEQYYSGSLQKDGVGLYVDMSKPVAAKEIVVYTGTPGFRAQIWASNSPPDPDVFVTGPGGWVRLADIPSMQHKQSIALPGSSTGPPKYRYYLVWIKTLPTGKLAAELNEIALYGSSR